MSLIAGTPKETEPLCSSPALSHTHSQLFSKLDNTDAQAQRHKVYVGVAPASVASVTNRPGGR